MKSRSFPILLVLIAAMTAANSFAAPAPKKEKEPPRPSGPLQMTVHLTGIFDSECEINLRTALAEIPGVALAKLDMATGEALFTYDPAAAFPATKPDKVVERFDQLLRQASGHLISARPASTTPKEKLKQIELPVVFLHCRACGLALHEMLMKQDGVEQVQIDLKKRTVQATIDPEKATSQQLAAFLKKREVTIKQ